jgi:hypothetical protein
VSTIRKRVIAGIVGIVYAVAYGFWTMLITGGGHGNFIWLFLFLFPEFLGLYFPLMLVLSVDLRSIFAKSLYGALIAFNLVVSAIMINGWVSEPGNDDRPSDYSRMVEINGIGTVLFMAALHFLPTLVFLLIWIRAFRSPRSANDEVY